jgi:energy-coupling factor transporter transmembrane protein EcfT
MTLLEMINLSIIIAIGLCLIVRPSLISQWLKPTAVFLIVLACVQMVMSGYSWRYLSAYGLIFLITLWAFAVKLLNGNIVPRRILQGVLIIVLPMVLLPWAVFAPVPPITFTHRVTPIRNTDFPVGRYQPPRRIFQ